MNAPMPTAHPAAADRAVSVEAPARLHLGFLDPAGTLGRPFGSLGLVVQGASTRVLVRSAPDDRDVVTAGDREAEAEVHRALQALQALQSRTGQRAPLHLHLSQVLPAHAGFGSGTQLALAVGRAFATWHRLDLPTQELARTLGRGLRSGVGIAGFDRGGLLLDGGPSGDGRPAALLSRMTLPAAWRVLLVLDPTRRGLSGPQEREALSRLPRFGREQAADLCHRVLMQVLPGVAGDDFATFAEGLSAMQALLGEHFAPAQDGEPYTSPEVGRLMRWIGSTRGPRGAAIGQSSWGPTAFAVLPCAAEAEALMRDAAQEGLVDPRLRWKVVAPRNEGARVIDHDSLARGMPAAEADSLWRWQPAGSVTSRPH